jgi:hypothetical protein
VLVFVVTNWIGQDYFAPQSYAFLIALVLVGVLLRTTPISRQSSPRFGVAAIQRLIAGRSHGDTGRIYGVFSPLGTGSVARTTVLMMLWGAVVTSHQLTPIFVMVTTVAIGVARGQMRWGLLAVMAASEIVWVALAYPYLSRHGFALFSLDPFRSSAPTLLDHSRMLAGVRVRSYAVNGLYFGMFALGVTGGLLRIRRGRIDMAPVLAAVSPVAVLVLQSYGGEARLRIYLFSLPYLAFLVAWLLDAAGRRSGWGPPAVRVVTASAICLLACPFLLAYFGQEKVNMVTADDVRASTWFYQNAPPDAWLAFVAANFPGRADPSYIRFPFVGDSDPSVVSSPEFQRTHSTAAAVRFMEDLGGSPYLVATPSQERYLELFGIMTPAEYDSFCHALDASSRMRLVYRHGGASIWQLTTPGTGG